MGVEAMPPGSFAIPSRRTADGDPAGRWRPGRRRGLSTPSRQAHGTAAPARGAVAA